MKCLFTKFLSSSALLCASLLCGTASAHHSIPSHYDLATVVELEGEVVRFVWTNPHVRFTMRVRDNQGREELWEVETSSVSILGRMGLSADIVKAGDRVKIAGNPARRSQHAMVAANMLFSDGKEVVLRNGGKPRWSDRIVGTQGPWLADAGNRSDPQRGIFRVWSRALSAPALFRAIETYPLTEQAKAAVRAFDPIRDDPTRDCNPKGMPNMMSNPYPIEFLKQNADIVLRLEEYDAVRTFHMAARPPGSTPPSPLGYSVGRWDGATLVVTTTGIGKRLFPYGIQLSERAEVVERFIPSADGSRLDYKLRVTDPVNFTKPVELESYRIWLPEAEVKPYKCTTD